MSDKKEFLKNNPAKKLNEWTEEDVEVTVHKPEFDEKTKRVTITQKKEKVKQKVYYAHSTPRKIICNDHFFLPMDPKRYIFRCRKCDYRFQGSTITHKYLPDTGKIVFRLNGQSIQNFV